jgi:hypothetical protein
MKQGEIEGRDSFIILSLKTAIAGAIYMDFNDLLSCLLPATMVG